MFRQVQLRKDCENNLPLGSFEHGHSVLVSYSYQTLSIHCNDLIASLQSAVSSRSAGWEDSFDVDWQVTVRTPMTTHDTETQAFGPAF